jgi:hypothetical protein
LTLAVVRDLQEARAPAGPEELVAFETDVLAGFVLARDAAGLSDGTISSDVVHPGAGPGLVRPAAVGDGARGRGLSPSGFETWISGFYRNMLLH